MKNNQRKQLYTAITLSLSMGSAMAQFAPEIELADIGATGAGFVLNGVAAGDYSGNSVSNAGDINGDGIDDVIIGARGAGPNGFQSGASYVVFGQDSGFGASLELADLNGANGFVLNGVSAIDRAGDSVSAAGDINGDGIDDLIIGAPYVDSNGSDSGASYVVFGNGSGFSSSLNLTDLDGSNGFVLNGVDTNGQSGRSVSATGDINGDGIDDLIIGAPYAGSNGSASYVVFGKNSGFGASLELADLNGTDGFVLNGVADLDSSGISVSAAGDINGDGIDDLIIGAPYADSNFISSGDSYVVFGNGSGFSSSLNLADLDGSNGFVLNGVAANDRSGFSVSAAGDINGDGFDDLIIGAFRAGPNGIYSGASYLVFGKSSGFGAALNLADLNGSNGFVLNGVAASNFSGRSVSAAGDINGDGFDDVIIGARGADTNGSSSGASYVVFGNGSGFSSSLNLTDLDGSNGFVLNGVAANDYSGSSVSAAGDVNGDGMDDLIIGAFRADPNSQSASGASYVVFGSFQCETGPHTYQVSTGAQLNHAIACANQSAGADVIELSADITYGKAHVTNASGSTATAAITSEITIDGQGHVLQRDAGLPACNDFQNNEPHEFRLLHVAPTGDLNLQNITLNNGCADGLATEASGGAVLNQGLLSVSNSVFNNNQARVGGAIANLEFEAAISAISHSQFTDNQASTGGAVFNGSSASVSFINNNQFTNNQALFGGALANVNGGFITAIENNTFVGNHADNGGGAINNTNGSGVAAFIDNLNNNTFSGNSSGQTGGALISFFSSIGNASNNTFYQNTAMTVGAAVRFDSAGSSALINSLFVGNNLNGTPENCSTTSGIFANNLSDIGGSGCGINSDTININLDIALANNGCVTPLVDGSCVLTHALGVGSAAIDAAFMGTFTDQRGFGVTGTRDVGAFEHDGVNPDVIFEDGFE